ncbi:MAG: 30S ribosomal protein S3 [Planctomycetota bacterium]|jgi:small subunit ribosomal protein S3
MGQKVSPIGFRTGITRGWQSTWFATKADYGYFLIEDQKIRRYVDNRFNRRMPKGAVAKTEIVRTRNEVKVTLHSARPGVVIEIKEPDLNAALVGEAIAEQLGKRASFRRTMKQFCEAAMNAGAKGVKIICSGRLAGSEMSRKETQKLGSIPLHTLDADVDYAVATARTTYGAIGVKVWIYRGKFGEENNDRPQRRRPPRRVGPGRRDRGSGAKRGASRGGAQPPAAAPAPAEPAAPPAVVEPPISPAVEPNNSEPNTTEAS